MQFGREQALIKWLCILMPRHRARMRKVSWGARGALSRSRQPNRARLGGRTDTGPQEVYVEGGPGARLRMARHSSGHVSSGLAPEVPRPTRPSQRARLRCALGSVALTAGKCTCHGTGRKLGPTAPTPPPST